ncbi:DLW-39 family protein [Aeromicrobium sp. PE09-221]|nr:DLW-39 family protein [Aeromicrobium sp. PE09-221]
MKKIIALIAVSAGAFLCWRRRSGGQDAWAQASDTV